MTFGMARWKTIDDKLAAQYCCKYRTSREAHLHYIQDHPEMINKKTGKPITYQAMFLAAWRWMIRNMAESHVMLKDLYAANGEVLDDETWKILMTSHARHALSAHGFDKWLKDNGLEAYRDVRQARTVTPKNQ